MERTQAREIFIMRLLARFELCAGVHIEENRKRALCAELELQRASLEQLTKAEKYILKVRAKYGTLTLPDFDPTQEMLREAGLYEAPKMYRSTR